MAGRRLQSFPARLLGPAFVLMLLAASLSPNMALAETAFDGGTAVIAHAGGDRVRLRSGPGLDQPEVTRLSEATPLSILEAMITAADGSTWYKVSTGDLTGYVAAEFVSATDDSSPAPATSAEASDTVNVRSGPSTADAVVTTLEAGESVTLTGADQSGWLPIAAVGGSGFVYNSFLTTSSLTSGVRYTLDRVRLRTGPGTSNRILATLPVGLKLNFNGEVDGGFAKVSSSYGTGWVSAQYIGKGAPSGSHSGGTRYTTDAVHLRRGPSSRNGSIAVMPVGVKLELSGAEENGFAKVSTRFGTGWVSTQYIGNSAPATTETAFTNDSVRLRTGPGSDYGTIRTLTVGTKLELTGTERNGYAKAVTRHGTGWIAMSYISSVAPQYTGGTRYTTESVNLRRGASSGSGVIRVVPSRSSIRFTGTVVSGYGKVSTSFGDGWISIDYFSKSRPSVSSGSLVVWPVKGGEWRVSQGYNGSSHQNENRHWQYYYSFDLKRTSGSTAWQPVYAPVSGKIRWIDESTGGMSIYMGDGLAFAMFHVYWASGIDEGDTITQGQYLGVIAPAGQANSGSSAHVHITAWRTWDGGNWSRSASPFVGRFAIEGVAFPSTGSRNDYLNYTFWP